MSNHCIIEFTVSDTGIGISEEKITFIFEKFTKLNSSYNTPYKGRGLGLSIVQQFLDSILFGNPAPPDIAQKREKIKERFKNTPIAGLTVPNYTEKSWHGELLARAPQTLLISGEATLRNLSPDLHDFYFNVFLPACKERVVELQRQKTADHEKEKQALKQQIESAAQEINRLISTVQEKERLLAKELTLLSQKPTAAQAQSINTLIKLYADNKTLADTLSAQQMRYSKLVADLEAKYGQSEKQNQLLVKEVAELRQALDSTRLTLTRILQRDGAEESNPSHTSTSPPIQSPRARLIIR